jgi:hypothetical protein
MRFAPTTFRPTFGRVLSVVVAAIAVAGIVGLVATGGLVEALRYGWALALVAALAFALFWFPSVRVAVEEITVRNVFMTVHVPWSAIQNVDTKFALTLTTTDGKVTAWASPAPNRYAAQVGNTVDARLAAAATGSAIRPGDLLSTTSGATAYLIRRHWEELRDDGLAESPALAVRRDIHWRTIATLGALTVASVLGTLL